MNKYQKILTILALLIFSGVTSSLADDSHDGNWWRAQKKVVKAIYITGMIDALYSGVGILTKDGLTKGTVAPGDGADVLLTCAKGFSAIKVERLADGLDRFYSDFRNRGITTAYALHIMQIELSGAPESEIRMWIELYQRASSEADAVLKQTGKGK
jgi:hypothetical protein